jgi:hypothetical protein
MKSRAWQVQLYDGTVSGWVSQRVAEEKIKSGQAVRLRRKAHQPFEVVRLKKEPEYARAYPVRAAMPRPDETVFPRKPAA